LSETTRRDNARAFGRDQAPTHAVTQGLGTILEARHLVLLATGEAKADAVAAALTGPVTPDCPASVVQLHPRVTVVVDETAAGVVFAGAGERRGSDADAVPRPPDRE
jgi:glucosamine-6-phosphate deaminase